MSEFTTSSDDETRRAEVRATLARLSRTGELPTLPSVATSALTIARDPGADVESLCRAIQTDVGIAARVLRVANSAVYGRRTVCKTLRDAVTTVGLRTMQDILSAAALRSVLDLRHPVAGRLWDHSLATAVAAEELAKVTGMLRRGGAFLPALFHDIGRIVFFLSDPVAYAAILEIEANGASDPLDTLEREWFGFDHCETGAALASDWGLPAEFCDAIQWHHDPSRAGAGQRQARLIGAADAFVYRMGLGTTPRPDVPVPTHDLSLDDEDAVLDAIRTAFEIERTTFQ